MVPICAHPPAPAASHCQGCPIDCGCARFWGHSDPQSCSGRGDQPLGCTDLCSLPHTPETTEKPPGLAPRVRGKCGHPPGSSHMACLPDPPEPAWNASLHGTTLRHCPFGTQSPPLAGEETPRTTVRWGPWKDKGGPGAWRARWVRRGYFGGEVTGSIWLCRQRSFSHGEPPALLSAIHLGLALR